MFSFGKSALDKGLDAFAKRRWKEARRHLEDASRDEHPRALGDYHLGLLYWRGLGGEREREAAIALFRRAADTGHAAAQTALGLALLGEDEVEARALFRSAAGAGDLNAMTELASMSAPREARDLLERAAEQGHGPAMRQLADLIMTHEPVEALGWLYACAALSGDEATRKRAAALAREMTADEITAAQKQGRLALKRIRLERGR